ncbi:MAG: hypothetical protein NVS4B10_18860 [Myxococcales bacterium]
MLDWLRSIFLSDGFLPHGHCYLWNQGLVFLHVVSDLLIGFAFLSIALTLQVLVRRVQLPFSPVILAVGILFGACGATHFLEVITLWYPIYWISGAVKAITAGASVATGLLLIPVIPKAVEVARSAKLAEERRLQLEVKNLELETLYSRVKQAEELKMRFFSGVSHELRTPLTLILGPLDHLRSSALTAEQRHDVEVAAGNAKLLLGHVNELLELARLDAGKVQLAWSDGDLAALLRLSLGHFNAPAGDARLRIIVDAPEHVPAQLDDEKVQRIVFNVLSNAFRFTPDGGLVRCVLTSETDHAVLSIEDSGPGIPEGDREAIFERFRQSAAAPARQHRGTGLGLAIARDFAALHGGNIRAGEAPGGGASFRIELPLRAPAGTEVAPAGKGTAFAAAPAGVLERPAPARQQDAGSALRLASDAERGLVLVCEDSPEMRRFIERSLRADFRVALAEDGAGALEQALALRPDLLITDMMMPTMTGEELLAQVRARAELAALPVMVLTARSDDETRVRLLRAGAQDYLTKPFLADELRARARNLISLSRARRILGEELESSQGELHLLAREVTTRKQELKTALVAMQVAREQAERASETKGTFLSLIPHELRTPLATLQLSLHALRRESPAYTLRQAEALRKIERSTHRLLDLIESVLDYTRAESGRLAVREETLDARTLALEVAGEVRPRAAQKGLELEVDAPEGLPALTTDRTLLRLVLVHLLHNGVKHTAEGVVTLRARHDGAGHCFEVEDTGPGIPREDRQRIFEPFEMVSPLSHKHLPGFGLGLPLVRHVVDALGGRIELDPASVAGSLFRVRLPFARRPARQPAASA